MRGTSLSHGPRGPRGQDALARLIFALLVVAVFGHVWFASTPLPFGGPNILPAIAATLLAVVLCLWRSAPSLRGANGLRRAFVAALPRHVRSAMPVLLTACAMWAWVLAVYWRTDTFDANRMGQLAVGIGVLFASLCVLSARRAKVLIAAIVVAVSLSALFGLCVLVVGGPFVDAWLRIAQVAESDLQVVLVYGRTAGAAVHTATFGYQLVVAIVLAFATLILGAPAHWGRWALASDAALFLLLTCMLAALVVNASHSTVLGVALGLGLCVVGVATAPFGRRGLVRLLVAGPSSLLVLLALFNPWFNAGNVVEELRPVPLQDGDIRNLAAGGQALLSDDPHVLGHRFEGHEPGVEYRIDLRARYAKGYGVRGVVKADADAAGDIVITWRGDAERSVVAYEFRLRKVGAGRAGQPPSWGSFAPALRSRGVLLTVADLTIGRAALARGDPDIIGAAISGLAPGQGYDLQLRTVVDGPTSQARGRADKDGRLVFSWRRAVLPSGLYQCRLRGSPNEPWSVWRSCQPSLPLPPVWPELRDGGETEPSAGEREGPAPRMKEPSAGVREGPAPRMKEPSAGEREGPAPRMKEPSAGVREGLAPSHERAREGPAPRRKEPSAGAGAERIGHEFAGFSPWKWYRVQIQEVLTAGVGRAPRHGEVVFSPRDTGYFVVTWPAPRAPEGVAGYRFRTRGVGANWLPWRAFTPSLSSKTPVLVLAPTGSSVAQDGQLIRHTLRGLPPGTRQSVQLRVRSGAVFGAESAAVDGVVAADGSFALAWRQPSEGNVAAVQFRRRLLASGSSATWLLWQELTPPVDGGRTVALSAPGRTGDEVVDAAHMAWRVGGGLQLRYRQALDFHARGRLAQAAAAWRYALDHPFGTGVYRPSRVHAGDAGEDVPDATFDELSRFWPHNQFLHVLVLYGFPGLCLLLLFYGFLARAAWRAGRLAWREPRAELRLLVVAVIAAWAAYSVNSLFVPTGPLLQDWSHCFVLGLLLSLEGILADEG